MRRCGNCYFRHQKDIREGGNLVCIKTNEDVSPEGKCPEHKYYEEVMEMQKGLVSAENWIGDGKNLLGLKGASAKFIAQLYKDGAKEIKVQLIDDERTSRAARIELPGGAYEQKKLLVKLITCRPENTVAALDDNDSNAVWLRLTAEAGK